jgi:hypothetical protein
MGGQIGSRNVWKCKEVKGKLIDVGKLLSRSLIHGLADF